MTNKVHLLFDAALLATPVAGCSKADALRYCTATLDCLNITNLPWVNAFMSVDGMQLLMSRGLHPSPRSLTSLLNDCKVDKFDANTLFMSVNKLLNNVLYIDSYYSIQRYAFQDIVTKPNIIDECNGDPFRLHTADCAMLIAILDKHCILDNILHVLMLKSPPTGSVEVSGNITMFDIDEHSTGRMHVPSDVVNGTIKVSGYVHDLIEHFDEADCLLTAVSDADIEFAIHIALFKATMQRNRLATWDSVSIPILTDTFRKTCQACCAEGNRALPGKILKAIVDMVNEQKLRKGHAIRQDRGGNSDVLVDGDGHWERWSIDRKMRLHYRKGPRNVLTLGSVVHHDTFSVP